MGRHAADRFSSGCPLRLSGGQSQTVQRVADDLMPMLYHAPDAWQTRAGLPFWWIDQSELEECAKCLKFVPDAGK